MATKHDSSGRCQRCQELLNYVDAPLRGWFEHTQSEDPAFHLSEGYRNKADQNADFLAHKSKAKFGQGPHNYKPVKAIDVFYLINGKYNGTMTNDQVVAKLKMLADHLPDTLEWGGYFPGTFKDHDHFQLKNWKTQVTNYPNGNE